MPPDERRSILLVDDSEAELELMRVYLAQWDGVLRVDTASHGAEALDHLHRRGRFAARAPGLPCLVVIDNKMPVMGGIDAAGAIRASPGMQTLPLVMWSGSADPGDIRRAYENGVTSYLVKPPRPALARDALQTVVKYWTELHRQPG